MKQRFLSILLTVTLMASVFAGAMGVSVRSARADDPADYGTGYFSEIAGQARTVLETLNLPSYLSYFDEMVEYCENYWDSKLIVVFHTLDTDNYIFCVYSWRTDLTFEYWSCNPTYMDMRCFYVGQYNKYFYCDYAFKLTSSSAQSLNNFHVQIDLASGDPANFSYTNNYFYYFPSYQILAYQDVVGYSNMLLRNYNGGNVTDYFSANLELNSPGPSYDQINLVTFNVGIKRFLTVDNQDYVQGMDLDKEGYSWAILGLDKDSNDYDVILKDSDLVVVPNAEFYTDELFNLATYGALCWELPDELDVIASSGFGVRNILGQIDSLVAVCVNCPYWINDELPTELQLQDQMYMNAFNTFNTYVESYNTTHVIPENLADTLFGLNGSRLYPCSVSVPKSVWNNNSTGASNQLADQHNWKWWFFSRSDLGINFELMDVVILSESANGQYSLLYYYSDSLNNPFQYVQNLSLQDVYENFDIVILVPDDLGCLEGNNWWKQLLETICQNLRISNLSSDMLSSLAISGSDSLGVEYVDSQPSDVAGILQGFCIVTKKALQRQQLYVFNDGITKTYKLMSDYIENRGKWEDSFLLWTASLFSQWQSLDGKLGDIYNLLYGWNLSSVLYDISESLARIANNTSEEDPGFWFLSLFNWLNRFSVIDSDFANWVSEYDDFTDDLPDPGTGATVIPFPTAIPTVAVGG